MKRSDISMLVLLGMLGVFGLYLISLPLLEISFGEASISTGNADGQITYSNRDVRLRNQKN